MDINYVLELAGFFCAGWVDAMTQLSSSLGTQPGMRAVLHRLSHEGLPQAVRVATRDYFQDCGLQMLEPDAASNLDIDFEILPGLRMGDKPVCRISPNSSSPCEAEWSIEPFGLGTADRPAVE